ncbi:hypothetical protein AZH53_06430 [Methanomicrobiaceae archaeon CYW5]|uniref:DUF1614 domain-containing protein n=1 Tax=Methanovulcanius yangii TaxID=1789227 RepID=UPI0029CA0718|nr:DUF1614 domain-containing protein [Methanovulcanius yangii]MBT8508041.1 hypothetical protein [Methanovulcanius yangii]
MRQYYFNPFSIILILFLIAILIFLIPLLLLGIIGGALESLGFSGWTILLLIVSIIAGSFINIPLTKIKGARKPDYVFRNRFGRVYTVHDSDDTVVAVNVGGAVIPVLISLYMFLNVATNAAAFPDPGAVILAALAGICIVAGATHAAARVVPGLGIATPFYVAPVVALLCGVVLEFSNPLAGPVIAFVAGTIGTLVGADLLNIRHLGRVGAPMVSIGGAGTFDGIFLSGVLAAFLA